MKRVNALWMVGVLACSAWVGCLEEEPESPPAAAPAEPPPPPPPPPKVEIPAYEPSGDFAEVKKAAAEGLNEDNAVDRARSLEAKLNAALAELKPKAAAEPAAAEAESPAAEGDGAAENEAAPTAPVEEPAAESDEAAE